MFYSTNPPLKLGHPSNQDTLTVAELEGVPYNKLFSILNTLWSRDGRYTEVLVCYCLFAFSEESMAFPQTPLD